MKYEIDSQVLEATKRLIVSEIKTAKENYNRESDFDRKANINSSIKNLKQSYNNLEVVSNPKPIRKVGIISK